ncbi:hypothetical protein V5799_008329 [Amblyomma americanum]|uniref:Uncharacterized protein n=1 Tax=Amblyomma americanum TaxID=6943 RepID=A0AAQ4FDP9_AMBAM
MHCALPIQAGRDMPKKPKSEKPAFGDKKATRRHSRSSKVVSTAVTPNPTTGMSGPSGPLPTTGDLAPYRTNAREEPAAASGQALKPHDDDQRSQRGPTAVTVPSLRSPDEPTAMAGRPNHPEPEAPASEETQDAQKGSENLPSLAPGAEARKEASQVLASELISPVTEQGKRNVSDTVSTGPPNSGRKGEAGGVSAKHQRRIIAQSPGISTASPPLVTQASTTAASLGSHGD